MGARMTRSDNDRELDELLAAIRKGLVDAIGDRSLRSVADAAGMKHTTVSRLVRGETIPDVATIWRLQRVLGVELWPADVNRRLVRRVGRR